VSDFVPDDDEPLGLQGWEDVGEGVVIRYYTQGDNNYVGVGLIEAHRNPAGEWCAGSILFDIPENAAYVGSPMWQVVSRDPLHLEPSLLCTRCQHHGWIRGGRWINA
jgi:hypothetical protein